MTSKDKLDIITGSAWVFLTALARRLTEQPNKLL